MVHANRSLGTQRAGAERRAAKEQAEQDSRKLMEALKRDPIPGQPGGHQDHAGCRERGTKRGADTAPLRGGSCREVQGIQSSPGRRPLAQWFPHCRLGKGASGAHLHGGRRRRLTRPTAWSSTGTTSTRAPRTQWPWGLSASCPSVSTLCVPPSWTSSLPPRRGVLRAQLGRPPWRRSTVLQRRLWRDRGQLLVHRCCAPGRN